MWDVHFELHHPTSCCHLVTQRRGWLKISKTIFHYSKPSAATIQSYVRGTYVASQNWLQCSSSTILILTSVPNSSPASERWRLKEMRCTVPWNYSKILLLILTMKYNIISEFLMIHVAITAKSEYNFNEFSRKYDYYTVQV